MEQKTVENNDVNDELAMSHSNERFEERNVKWLRHPLQGHQSVFGMKQVRHWQDNLNDWVKGQKEELLDDQATAG